MKRRIYDIEKSNIKTQYSGVDNERTLAALRAENASLVKELAHYGGDVSSMVPKIVNEALKARVAESGN